MEHKTLMNLKENTAVYDGLPPIVSPVSWIRCGRIKLDVYRPADDDVGFYCELIEDQEGLSADYSHGLEYFAFDLGNEEPTQVDAGQLPVEFFNHQLFDCGAKVKSGGNRVRAFMEEWGLLFSPLRNDWGCLDGWQFLETMSMQGVKETDVLLERMPELAGYAVSKLEAEATLSVLEELVLFLRKYIRSGGEDSKSLSMITGPLNAASCAPIRVECGSDVEESPFNRLAVKFTEQYLLEQEKGEERLEAYHRWLACLEDLWLQNGSDRRLKSPNRSLTLPESGLLTSAICNQILDVVANDDVPWRDCACDGCDVVFKYPQSPATSLNNDAYYCCPTHGARQRKRNSRTKPKS